MKKELTNNAAGLPTTPAALLIEQMPGANLAARLDCIERSLKKITDFLTLQNRTKQPGPEYISRKEAAELLRVTLPTLQQWTNSNILHAYKIGRRVYYKPAEISSAMIKKGVRYE